MAFEEVAAIEGGSILPSTDFDIVQTYHRLLNDDPEITMPVAAIEALIQLLTITHIKTVSETLDLIINQSAYLKSQVPNSISLSAGTDLFQRFLVSSLKPNFGGASFENVRQHLIGNGRLFANRAKAARERIAEIGAGFVRDGNVVLTHGGSRVVGSLLSKAAEVSKSEGNVRFKVIYLMNEECASESRAVVSSLRAKGIPVATIGEGAVGYALGKVSLVMVGAEGVVENGGIISRLGTYQIALLAKAAGKPFYVAAETHKFVRIYPLGQYDLGIEQNVIKYETQDENEVHNVTPSAKADIESANALVDFTPPALISAIISESGVLTPSVVGEELINVWIG
ncbi:Translation initiation factor eIF-2B subunit alpha [Erysiphe necator]|uniref:Translation initiation factor eIF2B subunit alpha n=1 Tax=Uncinula necator TaxID=52586 RepID=A0A0B1P155_UNCNE|nr:Translation initiation factor eIF-2B subunit alpha [Erysiphe necator]KHJ31963.1 putative translation initiation factor eif-2b subunit alpha [Erysiphe necator]